MSDIVLLTFTPTPNTGFPQSWKSMEKNLVMEKSWKMGKKNKVMEIQKGRGKVMEFLHCLSRITHEKFR